MADGETAGVYVDDDLLFPDDPAPVCTGGLFTLQICLQCPAGHVRVDTGEGTVTQTPCQEGPLDPPWLPHVPRLPAGPWPWSEA